jgi:hypothetical protein
MKSSFNKMKIKYIAWLLIVSSWFSSSGAFAAWDGQVSGKITQLDITGGQKLAVRVCLSGQTMCAGGATFAYLQDADSNCKVYVAALLSAQAQNLFKPCGWVLSYRIS